MNNLFNNFDDQAPICSVISGCFLNRHSFSRCCLILCKLFRGNFLMLLEPNLATQLMSWHSFRSSPCISTNRHLISFDFISTMLWPSMISLLTEITPQLQKESLFIEQSFFLKFLMLIKLFFPSIIHMVTNKQFFKYRH